LAGAEDRLLDANGGANKQSLEQMLLSRNKKLSNELTLLRVSHQDLTSKLSTLEDELSNANMELEKSKNLAATLENDLEVVQQEAANKFPSTAMSIAGTYTSKYPTSSYKSVRGGRSLSPTSSIISGFDPTSLSAASHEGAGGSSILPMITAQRDRYKRKIAELEAELQKSYQTIQALRSEVAALQKDNLTLYEKTRYVSSYSRPAAAPTSPSPTVIQMDNPNSEPALHRYRSAYEANLSPFSAFRNRETARVFKRMNVLERAVFQAVRMILATRLSRNLFALYCTGLHILVMYMTFSSGHGHPVVQTPTLVRNAPVAGAGARA
jgi:homeobox protein cut-like